MELLLSEIPEVAFRFCASFLSEEIAHELAMPLCFLDRWMENLHRSGKPDEDDLKVARAEITRLRRFVSALRGAKPPSLPEEPVMLAELIEEVREACITELGRERLGLQTAVDPRLMIRGDRVALGFVLRTMVQAVLGAELEEPMVEVDVSVTENSKGIVLSFAGARCLDGALGSLVPWNTVDPAALPLSVAGRMARAHGCALELEHQGARSVARLAIPRLLRVV